MNDIFKVYDFENEQQWLKGRMNGIGGSDASAVVGMNPYKSNIDAGLMSLAVDDDVNECNDNYL